jgi:hypothetical protein
VHSKDKARIVAKLQDRYCTERKSTVKECGAAQDYWVLNFIVSNSHLNAQLPRSEVIAVINEWAGFIPEPSRILAYMKRENELRSRWDVKSDQKGGR